MSRVFPLRVTRSIETLLMRALPRMYKSAFITRKRLSHPSRRGNISDRCNCFGRAPRRAVVLKWAIADSEGHVCERATIRCPIQSLVNRKLGFLSLGKLSGPVRRKGSQSGVAVADGLDFPKVLCNRRDVGPEIKCARENCAGPRYTFLLIEHATFMSSALQSVLALYLKK